MLAVSWARTALPGGSSFSSMQQVSCLLLRGLLQALGIPVKANIGVAEFIANLYIRQRLLDLF